MSTARDDNFMFVEYNPITGPQDHKQLQLRKQHVQYEYHRRLRRRQQVAQNSGSIPHIASYINHQKLSRPASAELSIAEEENHDSANEKAWEDVSGKLRSTTADSIYSLLGAGRLDPFNVYPLKSLPVHVHEVLDHALTHTWPGVAPSRSNTASNPVKSAWFSCAINSPMSFYAFVFAAGLHHSYAHQINDTTSSAALLRLSYQTQAIRLINEQLQHLRGPPSDALLVSILILGAHGANLDAVCDQPHPQSPLATAQLLDFYGSMKFEAQHMHALRVLVKLKGGLEAIRMDALADTILFGDLIRSTISISPPGFPLRQVPGSLVQSDRPVMDLQTKRYARRIGYGFNTLKRSRIQRRLAEVLDFMCDITVALDHHHRGMNGLKFLDIVAARNTAQHQLLSLPTLSTDPPAVDGYIYNTCCFAALIYSDMALFPLPAATGLKPKLASRLRRAMECDTSHSCWNSNPKLLLWAIFMGGVASWSTPNRSWFVAQFHGLRTRLGLVRWESAKMILSSYLWWDYVCEEPAIKLWYESEEIDDYSDSLWYNEVDKMHIALLSDQVEALMPEQDNV